MNPKSGVPFGGGRAVDCVAFLQWALPRLDLRWPGYRRVHKQVCKRIRRRLAALGLDDFHAYRKHLNVHPEEWSALDDCCRITISRFYRDKGVFDRIGREILPHLVRRALDREKIVRCWSAGCASGEEAYTLKLVWQEMVAVRDRSVALLIVATDADPRVLERARRGCYASGTLRDAPAHWLQSFFVPSGREYSVDPAYRDGIAFVQQDIRKQMPDDAFDLILCRNLVFTYFSVELQRRLLREIRERLVPGGFLIIGQHETLPEDVADLTHHAGPGRNYRKG